MDRGAWYATVHGVAKNRTRLSDFTLTFTHSLSDLPIMLAYLSLRLSKVSETLLQSQGLGQWAASLGLTSHLSELDSRWWQSSVILLTLCSCCVPSTPERIGSLAIETAAFCKWDRACVLWGWVAGAEKESPTSFQPLQVIRNGTVMELSFCLLIL